MEQSGIRAAQAAVGVLGRSLAYLMGGWAGAGVKASAGGSR